MWIRRNITSILLVLMFIGAECHKILVYNPRLGHSHVNFLGRIADILVEAGHDVVTFIPELDPDVKTNGTKRSRIILGPHFAAPISVQNLTKNAWVADAGTIWELYKVFQTVTKGELDACAAQLTDEETMRRLKAEHFDFAIAELISFCSFIVFHEIGLKNYASAFAMELIEVISDPLGVSSNPSFVPAMYAHHSNVMNYWERLSNFVLYMKLYVMNIFFAHRRNGLKVRSHALDGYNHIKATRKCSFAFVNAEEVLEFPRLYSHKVVFVGSIAVNKPKPLKKEYQRIMNASTNGAVLISFGSIAKSNLMPEAIKHSFYETFRSFPNITFIWKYEVDDDFASDLTNVIKKKWVPQIDLLAHQNMHAFVSHCGQNSLMESVNQGVPIICIPLFGDQMHNAKTAEVRQIGIYIDKFDLSPKLLTDAVGKIVYDKRYRQRSKRMQEMIKNKPISSRERLLRHIDFAVKFGPIDNFDVASNDLTFIQYYLLDIIIPLFLIVVLVVYLILQLILRAVRRILFLTKLKTE